MSILVIDVGTSGVRAAVVRPDATRRPRAPPRGAARLARAGPRRVRRRRAGRRRARRGPARRWPTAARSTRSASPTSGRRRSCGTAPPASRSGPASAGRTCARSATASCCRPRACASRPTCRPRRSATCSTPHDPDRSRDLCFGTVDTWIVWQLTEGAAARHRPAPTPRSPGLVTRRRHGVGRRGARRAAHPRVDAADDRRLDRRRRRGHRARRRAADRRHRRRPAGVAHRPGLRPTRAWPRSPSAPAGMLDVVRRPRAPVVRHAGRRRHLPDRRLAPAAARPTWGLEAIMLSAGTNVEWLRDDLGIIADRGRVARRRRAVRRHRRRRLRAGPARPRHAALGLRRPRHAARPHPGHEPRPRSCGPCSRASPSAAPTSSRPPRPTAARPIPVAAHRRRHERATRPSCRRSPTPRSGPSRCRR